MESIIDNVNTPAVDPANPEPVVTPQPAPADPAPVTEFDFSAIVGKDGNFSEKWRESLPEDIRHEACLDSMKNFATLVKSYVHGQHAIGAKRIALPGDNASESDWNNFYSAIGRPESAEKYEAKAPEGVTLDAETEKTFREAAFKMGLTPKQFQSLVDFDLARYQKQQQAAAARAASELAETKAKLQAEWGENYGNNLYQYKKALDTFGLTDLLAEKGLINHPGIIKALTKVGSAISESRLPDDAGKPVGGTIDQQISDLISSDAYAKLDGPQHEAAVAKLGELLARK